MRVHEQKLKGNTANASYSLHGIKRNVGRLRYGVNHLKQGFYFKFHAFGCALPAKVLRFCAFLSLNNAAGFSLTGKAYNLAFYKYLRAGVVVVRVCEVGK